MERLDPEKLHVEFRTGVTATEPIVGRRYTLTHSDTTAELLLVIGLEYAQDNFTANRDEVVGEWRTFQEYTFLSGYVYVNGQFGPFGAQSRNVVFRQELPLALEAIRYGDNEFFTAHPELDKAPIWMQFISSYPEFNKIEYWGTPETYK